MKTHTMEVGTILVSSGGYDQTNVSFYQVVARTRCTVDLVSMVAVSTGDAGFMSDHVVAGDALTGGLPVRKRVTVTDYGQSVRASWDHAYVWSGKPMYRSWYA